MKSFVSYLSKHIKSEAGFSLVEIITVTLLMAMLITTAAIGISIFFGKMLEINRWIELQEDAIECLNSIKNGVSVGTGNNQQYYGVANAKTMRLVASGIGGGGAYKLVCNPPAEDIMYTGDLVEFFFDGDHVRYRTVYAGSGSQNQYLFPSRNKKEYMKVTQFSLNQYNSGSDMKVVRVVLNARVETSKNKYRYVRFSTLMANRS